MTTDAFTATDYGFTATRPADELLLSIFLSRLRRLLRCRVERSPALNSDGIRLLDHAIFSTYCDCRTLGGQAIAQGLIQTGLRCARPSRSGAGLPV